MIHNLNMKRIGLPITFLFFAASLLGQAPKVLTFQQAVKIGLDNNLALNQQENLLISSRVAKTAGVMGMTPTVSINGNAGRQDGNSFNQQQGQVVNGVVDFIGANASTQLPLFQGLNNFNNYRAANNLYEAQLHLVKRSSQDVIRNVASQYLQCLLDRQIVEIRQKNLETQEQQYEQISEQVAAGSRAEVDLVNQEFQVKNAELTLLRANITLRNDVATLAQTLQIDPLQQITLEEPTWDVNLEDAEVPALESLNETAIESRSDLASAKYTEKANEFGFQATWGIYFPSVTAFAQYGSRYNYIHASETFTPQNRGFDEQFFNDNTQLTYGVTFSIPIYGGFNTRANVARNKALYENSKLTRENAEITVKSDVLRAYQNYRDARTSFESASSQLRSAELSYQLEQERYRLGISDIVALTQANQNFTQAQSDFQSAKYTLMFQKLLINYAAGTLKFEDIP